MGSVRCISTSHQTLGQRRENAVPSASNLRPPLGGVVFDVADVLYDATLWRRWLVRLVNHMGFAIDFASFCRVWRSQYQQDVHSGRREFAEALHSFLLACGLTWAQIDEIEAASRIRRDNVDQNLRALPGIVRAIARIGQRGVPLIAWADMPFPGAKVDSLLQNLGLADFFQAVLSSFDIGCAQPSVECYVAILEASGMPASEILYVGHDESSLAGARLAGLRTATIGDLGSTSSEIRLARAEDLLELFDCDPPRSLADDREPSRVSRSRSASAGAQGTCP